MKARITNKAVVCVGSPVVDQIAHISDDFLATVEGAKGGMELVDSETLAHLVETLPQAPVTAPGGSAGNTAFALARLNVSSRFVGVIGDDQGGSYYRNAFEEIGGDASRIRIKRETPTALCLSMVSPDGERTMRTHLGAAATLDAANVTLDDFAGYGHAHIEGYLLFNPDLMRHVLQTAQDAGCGTSVDLASFEIVAASQNQLPSLLKNYVDMVFANEEEAETFVGTSDLDACLRLLADCCDTVAVKIGAEGALLKNGDESCRIPAQSVDAVVDTTGAGDLWAAGFLAGLQRGWSLEQAGIAGSILGAAVVKQEGAFIPSSQWKAIRQRLADQP